MDHPVSKRKVHRISDFRFGGHFFVCYAIATEQAIGSPVLSNVKIILVMDGNILDEMVFTVDRGELIRAVDECDVALTGDSSGSHDSGVAAPVVAEKTDLPKIEWELVDYDWDLTKSKN